MKRSEIFEEYVKIAEDKEIAKDAPQKAKEKLEKNPRWDSQTQAIIEKLYNNKINMPKGMEYKKNIVEVAHPEKAIMSPAYDRINGLVENQNEQQNITLNLIMRNPSGQLNNFRYAELINALVKTANYLDIKNEDALRVLADSCLQNVNRKIKKLATPAAAAPPLLASPAVIAGIIAALYVHQHLPNVNRGYKQNYSRLVSELEDFIKSNTNMGVGYTYSQKLLSDVTSFKNKLESFNQLYNAAVPVLEGIEAPKTSEELLEMYPRPDTQKLIDIYNKLKSASENFLPFITRIERNFNSQEYKERNIENRGAITDLIDNTGILHGGKGLISDDFDDVVNAIDPYKRSVFDLINMFSESKQKGHEVETEIQQAQSEVQTSLYNRESDNDIDSKINEIERALAA